MFVPHAMRAGGVVGLVDKVGERDVAECRLSQPEVALGAGRGGAGRGGAGVRRVGMKQGCGVWGRQCGGSDSWRGCGRRSSERVWACGRAGVWACGREGA